MEQCRENIKRICGLGTNSLHVSRLDWYDFLDDANNHDSWKEGFDTVIACDCAYLYPDIAALTKTLKAVLRRTGSSRCIVWGPSHRGGLQSLLQLLRELCYHVDVREIDMKRYRLDAFVPDLDPLGTMGFLEAITEEGRHQQHYQGFSETTSTYLFVTLSLRMEQDDDGDLAASMSDID